METLTLTELKAIVAAMDISLTKCSLVDFLKHAATWTSLKSDAEQAIRDLTFEQEINPLPFPKD